MFKRKIKYTDFLGNEQEDEYRFNISKSELLELAAKDKTFNPDYLRYLLSEGKGLEMVDVMRKLIVVSYGELSDDGKKFRKNDDLALEFIQSAAYDKLFEDLIGAGNEELVKAFITGIFPAEFAAEIASIDAATVTTPAVVK